MDQTFSKFMQTFANTADADNTAIFMQQVLEFVGRLKQIFRKYHSELQNAETKLSLAWGNGNGRELVEMFVRTVGPYKHVIALKDESQIAVISQLPLVASLDIDLAGDWSKLSPGVKNVIWSYLQQLLVTAFKCTTLSKAFDVLKDEKTRNNLMETAGTMNESFVKDFGREIDVNNKADIEELARRLQSEMDANRLDIAKVVKSAIADK